MTSVSETPHPEPSLRCPTCKIVQPAGTKFCPNDGTPLGETAATQASVLTPAGGKRPHAAELTLPTMVGDRYRLEALRGGGGMAKVYRATDVTLDREVAVKLINPELRTEEEFDARFQREARIASQLSDPHIVVVHDFGFDPDHGPYLVMEYLHGQSLRERLSAAGKLPYMPVLQIAGQVFLAMIHAHEKGIVHRDIKPDNIFMVEQSGVRLHVRVLDFGIARIFRSDDPAGSHTITQHGAILGTPKYMSPEQLAGKPVDARTDIYSAALVLFEALTGDLPYAQTGKLRDLCPEVSPGFQDLIEGCLCPDAAGRPASSVEVYLRLQELGKASGILMLPAGTMSRLVAARNADANTQLYDSPADVRSRSRRKWLAYASAALAVVLLGVLGRWLFFGQPSYLPGPEGLHGVHIGDAPEDAEAKLTLTRSDTGNPWKLDRTRELIGNLLKPEDLRIPEADLKTIVIRRTADDLVVVMFYKNRVVGVVTSNRRGSTNRRVSVGSSATDLAGRYDDIAFSDSRIIEDEGKHVQVQRYDEIGLGFELQKGRVVSLTLYPPGAKK